MKYAFLQPKKGKLVIISAELTRLEKEKLLETLNKYKEAIAWSIEDLKGISPSICMHKILLENNAITSIEHQKRLNPVKKEVVKKEVLKWLNVGFIRRCVPETEQGGIMEKCHASSYGGNFAGDKTAQKILQSGFY